MHQPIKYRSDIDGLRALAILPVVFYHAGWWPFTGGYIGVDIFFVISGYLITSIIYQEMEKENFSFLKFYERRIRRILPALFFMLLVCSVAAYILMPVSRFSEFSENLIATIFFLSNFSLWSHSGGYFDVSGEIKPLLHTWSLSIEEQFYLLFPLFLIFLHHVCRKFSSRVLLYIFFYSIIFVSFGLSAATALFDTATKTAFFFLPFRAWEMGLGAVLALQLLPSLHNKHLSNVLSLVGIMCIIIPVFLYSDKTVFPGYASLVPCLGAALLIYSGDGHKTYVGHVLGLRSMVFIGLISYSLYLWHWPLLSFSRMIGLGNLDLTHSLIAVVLSFVLAILSWRYVERPFRGKSGVLTRKQLFIFIGLSSLVFVIFGGSSLWTDGWSGISRPLQAFIYSPDKLKIWQAQIENEEFVNKDLNVFKGRISRGLLIPSFAKVLCQKIGIGCLEYEKRYGVNVFADYNPSYILMGDSHAMYGLEKTLFSMARNDPSKFYSVADAGRWPLIGLQLGQWDAKPTMDIVLQSENIKTVITSNRYADKIYGPTSDFGPAEAGLVANGAVLTENSTGRVVGVSDIGAREELFQRYFSATVRRLLEAGKRVVIIYPVPEVGYDVPKELMKRLRDGEDVNGFYRPMDYFWKRNGFIISVMDSLGEHPNLVRIKPHEVLCDGHQCKTAVDGKPLYVDDNHLSQAGVNLLRPQLEAIFQDPNWN